jgi:hypothetical protein
MYSYLNIRVSFLDDFQIHGVFWDGFARPSGDMQLFILFSHTTSLVVSLT